MRNKGRANAQGKLYEATHGFPWKAILKIEIKEMEFFSNNPENSRGMVI